MTTMRYWFLLLVLLAMMAWPATTVAQSDGPGQPMVHIVQYGETMFSIAQRYGTTVDAVAHANGIPDPRQIYVGQRLLIPHGIDASAIWTTHIVRPGETLNAIARQYGLTRGTVAMANRVLNPHLLSPGRILQLPVEEGRTNGGALHVVQPEETLTRIAFHYGISLWELMEANSIANPALVLPGQWLLVPGERPSWMPYPFAAIELQPLPVRQGQALQIVVRTEEPVSLEGGFDEFFHSLPVQFAEEGGAYYALIGFEARTEPGLYELTLTATNETGEQAAVSIGIVVEEGGYGYERIDVPPSRDNLLDPSVVVAENQRLAEVRYLYTPERQWHGPFLRPVEAAISSYFGTRRSYNGGPYTDPHQGTDFNAGSGTAVRAPADGIVVMAEPLTVRGNVVILDHGWGVLTGYWHLSSFEVVVGQEVRAGDVIARVGNTGLSTGAHLHWEVWVGGVSVDGRQWLATTYPWTALDAGVAPW